jgi:putative flippase GtrA
MSVQGSHSILLRRAIRFTSTGILVTTLHIFIATLVMEYVLAIPPLANGVAFFFSTIISFLINTIWSFSSHLNGKTLFRFVAVSLIGLLVAMGVSSAAQYIGLHYLYGICAVALVVPPLTFILHNLWTYK